MVLTRVVMLKYPDSPPGGQAPVGHTPAHVVSGLRPLIVTFHPALLLHLIKHPKFKLGIYIIKNSNEKYTSSKVQEVPTARPRKVQVVPTARPRKVQVVPTARPRKVQVVPTARPRKVQVVPTARPRKVQVVPTARPRKVEVGQLLFLKLKHITNLEHSYA